MNAIIKKFLEWIKREKLYNIVIGAVGVLAIVVLAGFLSFLKNDVSETPRLPTLSSVIKATDSALGDGFKRYTNFEYQFSVDYPEELEAEAFQEEEGETIVFRRPEDKEKNLPKEKLGFQIFVSAFEEETTLTQERILKDAPSTVIEDPQEVIIGGNIPALLFWSENPVIGKTREVWFTDGKGYLYEVTTYAHLDTLLAGILSTWKFIEVAPLHRGDSQ